MRVYDKEHSRLSPYHPRFPVRCGEPLVLRLHLQPGFGSFPLAPLSLKQRLSSPALRVRPCISLWYNMINPIASPNATAQYLP
jgi:hypothetical protein